MIDRVDIVERGLDKLVWDLQDKPNLEKLFRLFLEEVQEIEDTLISILDIKDIDVAIGVQLDNIGLILGEERLGRGDEEYRDAIKFKISINTANGTYQSIYDTIKNYTKSERLKITRSSIAFATLYLNGKVNISAVTWKLLDAIKPTGTRWVIQSDLYDTAFLLAWEQKTGDLETFQVSLDGTSYEPFQVSINGVDFEDLFLGDEGIQLYQPSLVGGRNTFHWEEPEVFEVSINGIDYEPLFLDDEAGTYPEFKVVTGVPLEKGFVPFTWEINSKSAIIG